MVVLREFNKRHYVIGYGQRGVYFLKNEFNEAYVLLNRFLGSNGSSYFAGNCEGVIYKLLIIHCVFNNIRSIKVLIAIMKAVISHI